MARSNLVNAVDVALADPVGGADPTIRVTDPELLPPIPFYLVVDPFNQTTGREYMLATAILVDVLTVTRNLAGSESTTHDAGDIVRITYVAQHLDDLFDYTDAQDHDHATPIAAHAGIAEVHHTRYTDAEADARAALQDHDHATPIAAHAAIANAHHEKTPDQTFLHANLTDVAADQHHARYTDAEAVAAVGDPGAGVYLPLVGGVLSGSLTVNANMTINVGPLDILQPAPNARFMRFQTDASRGMEIRRSASFGQVELWSSLDGGATLKMMMFPMDAVQEQAIQCYVPFNMNHELSVYNQLSIGDGSTLVKLAMTGGGGGVMGTVLTLDSHSWYRGYGIFFRENETNNSWFFGKPYTGGTTALQVMFGEGVGFSEDTRDYVATALFGPPGSTGGQIRNIFTGGGAPAPELGEDGDVYIRYS